MNLLIAHMRYMGPPEEYQKTMEAVKEDEATRRWWKVRLHPKTWRGRSELMEA